MVNICICGGGNLGHVTAGFLAAQEGNHVTVLTRRPEEWAEILEVTDMEGRVFRGNVHPTADVAAAVSMADIVVVCLPGYAIHDELEKIRDFLKSTAIVGTVVSSTGFFFEAFKVLPEHIGLFGFQRVPFISRVKDYGHSAELKGYKASLNIAVERTADKEAVRQQVETLFKTPVCLLRSYYDVSLSNSNPLLHTARLFTMFGDWEEGKVYERNPQFYADWTVEASDLYIAMDGELQRLLEILPVDKGSIPPVLEYYESHDAKSLTEKIKSIPAFRNILSPMQETGEGLIPDFRSRYFTEDFPYGMRFIVETAAEHGIQIPLIQKVYQWGMSKIEMA